MKHKKDLSTASTYIIVPLVAIVGVLLSVFWFGMKPATIAYYQVVLDQGWSLAAVWVGIYFMFLWGPAAYFGLFQAAALKELKDRLFGP